MYLVLSINRGKRLFKTGDLIGCLALLQATVLGTEQVIFGVLRRHGTVVGRNELIGIVSKSGTFAGKEILAVGGSFDHLRLTCRLISMHQCALVVNVWTDHLRTPPGRESDQPS